MSLAEFPEIQKLTDLQKLELIGELWDSLESTGSDAPLAPWQQEMLAERLAAEVDRPADVLGLEEFEQRVRELMERN